MKSVVTSVIATLMLLGILSATAMQTPPKTNTTVVVAGGLPMPTCDPGNCALPGVTSVTNR